LPHVPTVFATVGRIARGRARGQKSENINKHQQDELLELLEPSLHQSTRLSARTREQKILEISFLP
jgi:hypothetical protein